jgi:hypothetical protein
MGKVGIGMPAALLLEQFGAMVSDAFDGEVPYRVGSSLTTTAWRDVDVRIMLDDDKYEAMGFGDPAHPHRNAKWVAYTLAFSALGKAMTGLPIDFQIQQTSEANDKHDGGRSALGIVSRLTNAARAATTGEGSNELRIRYRNRGGRVLLRVDHRIRCRVCCGWLYRREVRMTNDHTKLAGRLTEAQVLAMRVIGMTDAESLTCIPQADGMLVVSAMDDDGKTYALDLQSLFKALAAEPEAPVPNPTDTARALVERFETAWSAAMWHPSISNKVDLTNARAALVAHVEGVERDAERWRFSLTLLGAQTPADALPNDANQLLRTCYQVAEREHAKPNSTNWPALRDRIHDALKQQHAHMYPDTTRPTEARDA